MPGTIKKIVILGAGFGGLNAALKLGRALKWRRIKNHEIILIDKNDYHTYTPTLYEAATTSKNVADAINLKSIVTIPISKIIKGLPVQFIEDEVTTIDADAKDGIIYLKSGYNLRYDYLVMSLGSVTNDFEIPGLKEFGLSFKTFDDAILIRDRVWEEMTSEGAKDKPELKIIIGGAGSTGVELAGELRVWLNQLSKHHGRKASVTIIEANPTILYGFKQDVINLADARLKKIGVETILDKKIQSASKEDKKIYLDNNHAIDADIFVWAGGVKANNLIGKMPLKTSRGRAEVSTTMTCLAEQPDLTLAGKIFGIGDVVCVYDQLSGKPVPMVARAAIDGGEIAAANIIRDIKGKKHIEYKPADYPYVIPIGGKYAVARIGNFVISGLIAWLLKGLVELNYLLSVTGSLRAFTIWIRGLFIFLKNDRLG